MTADDATTARRKAMANAIRVKLADLFARQSWDAARVPDELAEAADKAAQEYQLNIGNTGPRIYLIGGVPVTDETTPMEKRKGTP